MKKCILPVLALLLLVSCSFPITINITTGATATPEAPQPILITATSEPAAAATAAPVVEGVQRNFGGVTMTIPACLAADGEGIIIPEENLGADIGPAMSTPQYRQITLVGYPLSDKFWEPRIKVYPVARWEELAPGLISPKVPELQALTASPTLTENSSIPFLPSLGAAMAFQAQESILNFQNGSGVGFLTEFSQYYVPVNNDELFYAYQGVTSDGKYWVSVFLPVNAPYLQASAEDTAVPADGIVQPNMNAASDEMKAYYDQMESKLNSTPDDTFTPSLSCIRQFVQSLQISD